MKCLVYHVRRYGPANLYKFKASVPWPRAKSSLKKNMYMCTHITAYLMLSLIYMTSLQRTMLWPRQDLRVQGHCPQMRQNMSMHNSGFPHFGIKKFKDFSRVFLRTFFTFSRTFAGKINQPFSSSSGIVFCGKLYF